MRTTTQRICGELWFDPAVETRPFGATGITVSVLGLGAGALGEPDVTDADGDRLLGAALELGINLVDTARSYGASEERIGRFLRGRRDRVVVSTKVGYGVEGIPDWTGECVARGIDGALARMRVETIDVVHLHSCPVEILERGEVIEALDRAVAAGKVRVAAYSGDGAALACAVGDARFRAIQCSVNVCDQEALGASVPRAAARGMGVIAKRPLANGPWRFAREPDRGDLAEYRRRWLALDLALDGMAPDELTLRFALSVPGVSSCLIGTRDPEHLARNAEIAAKGVLPKERIESIRATWRARGAWPGMI